MGRRDVASKHPPIGVPTGCITGHQAL